jgi:hypothetical protein
MNTYGSTLVASTYLSFVSDHHGDTNVYVDAHNGAGQVLVTTLDHFALGQISASDEIRPIDAKKAGAKSAGLTSAASALYTVIGRSAGTSGNTNVRHR